MSIHNGCVDFMPILLDTSGSYHLERMYQSIMFVREFIQVFPETTSPYHLHVLIYNGHLGVDTPIPGYTGSLDNIVPPFSY